MLKWSGSGFFDLRDDKDNIILWIGPSGKNGFSIRSKVVPCFYNEMPRPSVASAKSTALRTLSEYYKQSLADVEALMDVPEWVEVSDDLWQYRSGDTVLGDVVVFPDDGARWWGRVGDTAKAFALLSDAKAWVKGECL